MLKSHLKLWVVADEVLHEHVEILGYFISGLGEVIISLGIAVSRSNGVVDEKDIGRLNLENMKYEKF